MAAWQHVKCCRLSITSIIYFFGGSYCFWRYFNQSRTIISDVIHPFSLCSSCCCWSWSISIKHESHVTFSLRTNNMTNIQQSSPWNSVLHRCEFSVYLSSLVPFRCWIFLVTPRIFYQTVSKENLLSFFSVVTFTSPYCEAGLVKLKCCTLQPWLPNLRRLLLLGNR